MNVEKNTLDLIVAFEKAFQQLVGFACKISGDFLSELG